MRVSDNKLILKSDYLFHIIKNDGIKYKYRLDNPTADILINKLAFRRVDSIKILKNKLDLTQTPYKILNDHAVSIYKLISNSNRLIYSDITIASDLEVHLERGIAGSRRLFSDFCQIEVELNDVTVDNLRSAFIRSSIQRITLGNVKVTDANSLDGMCSCCKDLKLFDFGQADLSDTRYFDAIFDGCEKLETVICNNKTIKDIKAMTNLFKDCKSIREIHLPNFEIDAYGYELRTHDMFCNNDNLEYIDLSSVDSSLYGTKAFGTIGNKKACTIKFRDKTITV